MAKIGRWWGMATLALALACTRVSHDYVAGGPIAFDVSSTSALLWTRAPDAAQVRFELDPPDARPEPVAPSAERDFTARVRVDGLRPATDYTVHVKGSPPGRFRTAPAADAAAPLRIAFGGDVAGQNVCRDAKTGFRAITAIADYKPDLFIGLGDQIYADGTCDAVGHYGNAQVPGNLVPARDLPNYWAHWRYVRADAGLGKLLASTAYVPVWDDHEVVNDFDSTQPLMPIGLQAFLDYNPVSSESADAPRRLYRTLRLGKHVELFVLDTRQYRDANAAPDTGEGKSMLGAAQLAWLEEKLAASDATWKVIVSSVPLALPTGSDAAVKGRDGWAGIDQPTGFAHERERILRFLAEHGVATPIWITTDVHLAELFVHRPFAERPEFQVVEAISGPLSAGLGVQQPPDPALHSEVRFVHAAPADPPVERWDDALRYFNFGALEVAADGTLTVRIVGATGATLHAESFAPAAPGS